MSTASGLYLGLFIVAIILLICYHKAGKLFQCFFFTAFTGIGALGFLWAVGRLVDFPITIAPLSLAISAILGIPGVVGMLIFQLL